MPTTRRSLPRLGSAGVIVLILLAAGPADAQTTYTWDNANPLGDWLTPTKWTGGPAGTHPGVLTGGSANGNARDVAVFNHFPAGGAGAGIALSNTTSLNLGAINMTGALADAVVGNSGTGNGALILNGAATPIGGYSNVVLANTSSNRWLFLNNAVGGGGNQTMTVRLGTANGVVLVSPTRTIQVNTALTDFVAGAGLTLRGGGTLVLNGTVGYTGRTHVAEGTLYFWSSGTGNVVGDIHNDAWVAYDRFATSTFSGNLSGAGNWAVPTGGLTLTGTNTHTGKTHVVAPHNPFAPIRLTFGSAAALGAASARYHFTDGAVLGTTYAIDQGLLNRIDPASRGYVDMRVDSGNALDFSALPNVSLGTTTGGSGGADRAYSGTITPANNTYRLGGGSATLEVTSALTGAARSVLVTGPVALTGANTYGGPTVIDVGGELVVGVVNNGGTIGPLGTSSADPANLVLRGGALRYNGSPGTTDRGLTIQGGATYAGFPEQVLRFTGDLVRGPQATLNATAAVSLGLTTVNGVPLANVPINGIIPWATVGTGTNVQFASLGSGSSLGGAGGTTSTLAGAGPTDNVVVSSAQSVAADQTINSIRSNNVDVTINTGVTLTLASGGLILRPGTVSVPSLPGGGRITSGNVVNGTAELYVHTGVAGSGESGIDAIVADNGSTPLVLVKHGPGGLALGGVNTHTGGTVVNGGTVYAERPTALGTGPVTINPGPVQGNTLVGGLLTRAVATIANPITVTAAAGGEVVVGSQAGFVSGPVETVFTGTITFARPLTFQGGNDAGTRFTGRLTGGTSDVHVTSVNPTTGTFLVTFDSAQPNTFGNLYLGRNGILQLGAGVAAIGNNQVADTANVYFAPRAQLWALRASAAGADGETVGALISQTPGSGRILTYGTGTGVAPFTLTIGAGNGSGEYGGSIVEFGTGNSAPITLVKVGTGTQVLTGSAHSYRGGTRVEGGTLLVNTYSPFIGFTGLGDGRVDVGVNGTLGGNGSFSTGGLGTHVAGTITAGTGAGEGRNDLHIGYGINMLAGSRYVVRVFDTGPADASHLDVTGTTTINTDRLVLDLAGVDPDAMRAAVGLGNTRVYTVMTSTDLGGTGFTAGGFTIVNDPGFLPGEWAFDSFDTVNDRVTIRFAPVPEPAAVLAVAAALAGWRMRRRHTFLKSVTTSNVPSGSGTRL